MTKHTQQPQSIFDSALLMGALFDSFKKLDPRTLWRNPVMLCVEIASVITLVTFVMSLTGANTEPAWFTGTVSVWLWLTLVILIIGALTFFPALSMGPIVEHLTMLGGI